MRRERRAVATQVAVLFAVALAVRALHLYAMRRSPLFEVLLGDAAQYDRWARRIAGGEWLGTEVFYQTPLYPYLLGVVYWIFGPDPWIVRILQALFGAASCAFLARAAAGFFSERAGWIAGLLLALQPAALFFDSILQKASLDLLLMSALLWRIAASQRAPTRAGFVAAGALLGLLILNRENAAVLVPVLLAWAAWLGGAQTRALVAPALVAAGLAAALVPVGTRNAWIGGAFLVTTSQMGSNFYIGNHRGADGGYTPMRAGRGEASFEREDARLLAEADSGRALAPDEISDYWMARTLADIRAAPGEWLRLLAWKWFLTWNRVDLVDVEAIGTHGRESPLLGALDRVAHLGVLLPLAVAGVFWTRRDWRRLWVLYALALAFAAAVTLFYVFARYRYPLVPIVTLFAGAGVAAFPSRSRELLAGVALAIAAAVFANWTVPQRYVDDAITWYNVGSTLLDQGRSAEALALLERARDADPAFPETYNNLGRAQLAQGDAAEARRSLERGVALAPDHALLHFNLAVVASQQGDAAATRALLERAIALDPLLARAYGPLAELEFRAGDRAAAIAHLRRATALEPASARAHADLGLALLLNGAAAEAVAALREAVRLDPTLVPPRNHLAWTLATAADPLLRDATAARALATETARGVDPPDPELLATRAAAEAATGDFATATSTAGEAIALARARNAEALAERIERQRGVYASGRALHEAVSAPP